MGRPRSARYSEKRAASARARYLRDIEASRAQHRIASEKKRRKRGQMTMAEYRAKVAAKASTRASERRAAIAESIAQKRRETLARQAATKTARHARQREQQKAWREANRDKSRALQKAWRERNQEKRRIDKRARKAAKRITLVRELTKLQRGRCAYCRRMLAGEFHVDHVMPLKRGGPDRRSNLQLTCVPCNLAKSAQHPITFAQSKGMLL